VSNLEEKRTAFVTSAWQRDWTVVLEKSRFRMAVESHCHSFSEVIVVLNNFDSPEEAARALRAARKLQSDGLASRVITAEETLSEAVLESFGLNPERFWKRNPWFATVHLAALHTLRNNADWLVYQNGDVWMNRFAAWIPRALTLLQENPEVRGLNLCRNIYVDHYPRHMDRETGDLWISNWWGSRPVEGEFRPGFTLSDHAYLLPVSPAGGWNFGFEDEELEQFHDRWPQYATPCFEMLYNLAMKRDGFAHGALKPADGLPITKHKSFPKNSPFKLLFYRALGFYRPGGKWATKAVRQ
jgi:hypothetical protein